MAVAGHSTLRTGPSCSRVTKTSRDDRQKVCTMMIPQATIRITASQNGKNPLFGPSVPQPMPRRTASKRTTPPNSIRREAVTKSAVRISLVQQPAFRHQIAVQLLIFLHPFHILRACGKCRLECSLFQIFFEIRRVEDFFEEA